MYPFARDRIDARRSLSWSDTVSMTTWTSGASSLNWRSASSPLSFGMVISIRTRSGLKASAASTAARPSPTCPTTSKPAASSKLTTPSRNREGSSATSMRKTLSPPERSVDGDARALPGGRGEFEGRPDRFGPFPHRAQSKALRRIGFHHCGPETGAMIRDGQVEDRLTCLKDYRGSAGGSVLADVRQSLLDDAQQLQLGLGVEPGSFNPRADGQFNRNPAQPAEVKCVVVEGVGKTCAGLVGGPQSQDRLPNVGKQVA